MKLKKQGKALRVILVLAWVFGILVPLYSFRRFSAGYQTAFDWVFHTHASHVLMHTFLYAVLGYLLCLLFSLPIRASLRLLVCVLLVVVIVAGFQEAIQMTCEHVALGGNEIFDFFVDLNGGLLGALFFFRIARSRITTAGRVALGLSC